MTRADRHDRDRWTSSGLPDAVVTIMFRDGTLPPPHASRWYDSSLTTEEIVQFRRAGRPAPDEAVAASLDARGLPHDPTFVASWEGFDAAAILEAIDRGFTSSDRFLPWAGTDADIAEVEQLSALDTSEEFDREQALDQLRAGYGAEVIGYAFESGIGVKKAARWMKRGFSAPTARAWSQAGFSPSTAAEWIDAVEEPEVARLLRKLGFGVDAVGERRPAGGWTNDDVRRHVAVVAGASDDVADEWAATELGHRKLAKWVAAGVRPSEADRWSQLEFGAAEASRWAAHGFDPEGAAAWRATSVDPEIAARRRDAGVRPQP